MKPSRRIRLAVEADLAAINDIFNHYVLYSTCTYQEQPESMDARRQWFLHRDEKHPVIVVEVAEIVVGWGSLSAYHERSAYRFTVENSVYVHPEHHRRGIGSMLLEDLVGRARRAGHRVIIAGIDGEQAASRALHAKFQFEEVGRLRHVGFKFGCWLDVIYMELRLDQV